MQHTHTHSFFLLNFTHTPHNYMFTRVQTQNFKMKHIKHIQNGYLGIHKKI
jgi:hypothetical protein